MDNSEQIAHEVVKRKRNRPDLQNFGNDLAEPGDNAKYISFALQSWESEPIDINDAEQVKRRIEDYFKRCQAHDMKPGVVGLANALGVTRATLWAWKTGERRGSDTAHVDLIKKAYSLLEELWEDYMLNGKVSPPNGIFLGKNHFGYRDVADVVITPNTPLGDNPSAPALADKYMNVIETSAEEQK